MEQSQYDQPDLEYGAFLYDDPYKMLATNLISRLTLGELQRFMVDNKYVLQVITHELQDLDIGSPFLDCAQDVLFRKNEKVKYKHAIADLALFVYQELDIKKLRNDIANFFTSCGIDLLSK